MTLALPNNLTRKIIVLLFAALLLLLATPAHAQTATDSAENVKKFKITFPIAELGNCADLTACKAYCDDPINKDVCLTYAESKGFAKNKKKLNNIASKVLIEARTALGCSTDQECKAFCKLEENREKCSEFARTYRLRGGLKMGTPSAQFRELRNASGSAEKFNPNSPNAFEHANANAKFCRENPGKCTKESSAPGQLKKDQREIEKELGEEEVKIKKEIEKLRMENRKERGEMEKKRMEERNLKKELDEEEVKGVSSSPSLFQQFLNLFK